jgi:uncharacterized protein DUF4159
MNCRMAGLQKRRIAIFCLSAMMMLPASVAFAQRFLFGDGTGYEPPARNIPYDGRFTFARIKYTPCCGSMGYYYRGLPGWAHGYVPDPRRGSGQAEGNLMKIMDEVTYLHPHTDGTVVYGFDDPGLFKFPVAYMAEPGFWTMNDKEAAGLRAYLKKGGFLILDDFRHDGDPRQGGGWDNMEGNVRRAIPGAQLLPMNPSMVVFDSFFKIESFDVIPQDYDRDRPEFFGLFEDNDPNKRLMMIVNYSTDVSNFWEFSATGFRPIEDSNQAYKLGVNYIMYGITH